ERGSMSASPFEPTRLYQQCALLAVLALLSHGCNVAPLITPIPESDDPVIQSLLAPAPRLPIGMYDYFGTFKTPVEARRMVTDAGLDPDQPSNFLRIGLVEVTDELIEEGRQRFFTQPLGDPSSASQIFATGTNLGEVDISVLAP